MSGSVRPLRQSRPRNNKNKNVHQPPAKVDVAPYAAALRRDGVVRINSVLSEATAQTMREWVVSYRAESEALVQSGKVAATERFADVLLRHNRCDMTLPLGPNPVMDALYSVLCQSAVVPELLRVAFRTDDEDGSDNHGGIDDPVLYELSTLISDPGSQRQVVHPDNPILAGGGAGRAAEDGASDDGSNNNNNNNNGATAPVLLTCFVALQDVTEDMGPTVYLPGTHTKEAHKQFFSGDGDGGGGDGTPSPKDALLEANPKVLGLLGRGDCSLYDSRVLHCGSANRHPHQSRALFYMSFRNPRVADPGNPASIRPGLAARQLTLSQLQTLLVEHWTTGMTATLGTM
jgi:Phytanoyl-CoA dioxygenase (PhyH)